MSSKSDILKASEPVACPECSEMFLLPEGMEADASLACPHCDVEITGQQIMEKMLPTAAIVKTGSSATGPAEEAAPAIEQAASTSRTGGVSHLIDEQGYSIPKPLKTAQRRGSSRYPERKKSKKSRKKKEEAKSGGLGEILRIAFGFVLALPIAQLILWWAFTVDPLGIAPTVHNFAPFLVPASVYEPEPVTREERSANKDMPPSQKLRDTHIPISIKQ